MTLYKKLQKSTKSIGNWSWFPDFFDTFFITTRQNLLKSMILQKLLISFEKKNWSKIFDQNSKSAIFVIFYIILARKWLRNWCYDHEISENEQPNEQKYRKCSNADLIQILAICKVLYTSKIISQTIEFRVPKVNSNLQNRENENSLKRWCQKFS